MQSTMTQDQKRIGIFIDGSNTWHCQKANRWRIDFFKLKEFLSLRGQISGLYYFTPDAPYFKNFLKTLDALGYSVVKKPLKKIRVRRKKGISQFTYKGNLDMEMGLMMVANIDLYDEYIVISGDSDFEVVLNLLRNKGKNVVAMCNKSALSIEMRRASNQVVYFHEIKKQIKYKKSRPKSGLTPYE